MSTETCHNCHTPHDSGQMQTVQLPPVKTKDGAQSGELVKVCPHCVALESHLGKVVVAPKAKGKAKAKGKSAGKKPAKKSKK